jgi:hypothetical protein
MSTLNLPLLTMTAANVLSNSPLTLEPTLLKRWTVQDYHRMSEVGILPPCERTELLSEHITLMAAKETPHVTSLHLPANALREPTSTGYTHHLILTEPNQASPSAFPSLTLFLTQILPPMT